MKALAADLSSRTASIVIPDPGSSPGQARSGIHAVSQAVPSEVAWIAGQARNDSSATTGTWSLGRSFLRGSLSITQLVTVGLSASLTRM